jgi:hypothetical protein
MVIPNHYIWDDLMISVVFNGNLNFDLEGTEVGEIIEVVVLEYEVVSTRTRVRSC